MQKAVLWCLVSAMVSTEMDVEARCGSSSCGYVHLLEQEEAVKGIIGRLLPDYRHLFRVHGIKDCGHDHHATACFEVYVSAGLIHIHGTSGNTHSCTVLSMLMQSLQRCRTLRLSTQPCWAMPDICAWW